MEIYIILAFTKFISFTTAQYDLNGSPDFVIHGTMETITLKCTTAEQYIRWDKDKGLIAVITGVNTNGLCSFGGPPNTNFTYKCDHENNVYSITTIVNVITDFNIIEWRCGPVAGSGFSTFSYSFFAPITTVKITTEKDINENGVIELIEGESQTFTCTTNPSRPAAWIHWHIGGRNVTEYAQGQPNVQHGERYNSSSKITYKANNKDHLKIIYCNAVNIEGGAKMNSSNIYLHILVPTTKIAITPTGYNNTVEVVKEQSKTFTCTTDSSRPAALIQWYFGGQNVTNQTKMLQTGNESDLFKSFSSFNYTGKPVDDGQYIYCEALNIKGRTKVKSHMLNINILIPVTLVTITPSGYNNEINVVEGENRTFTCTTDHSRPAAFIHWYIGEQNVTNQAKLQTPKQFGDSVSSSSRFTYAGIDKDHTKVIFCQAFNVVNRQKIKSAEIELYIQLPIKMATISPASDNNVMNVIEGDTQTFNCITDYGRPAAWIQWYIGGKNVTNQAETQTPQQDGHNISTSISKLKYTAVTADHKKVIFCEGINIEGRQKVNSNNMLLFINVRVSSVTLTTVDDKNEINVVEDEIRTFTCITDASRPAASIEWYIGEQNVTDKVKKQQITQKDGDKFVSTSILEYIGRQDNHNTVIYCEALNIDGQYRIKSAMKVLNILFKPRSIALYPPITIYRLKEYVSIDVANCSATCRPECQYYWTGPNQFILNQSNLRFDSAHRNESGVYECHGINNVGSVSSDSVAIFIDCELQAPTTVIAICKFNSAVIIWTFQSNECLHRFFHIKFWKQESSHFETVPSLMDKTNKTNVIQYEVNGLSANTSYRFSAVVGNYFSNISSKIVECQTDNFPRGFCSEASKSNMLFEAGISTLGVSVLVLLILMIFILKYRIWDRTKQRFSRHHTYTDTALTNPVLSDAYEMVDESLNSDDKDRNRRTDSVHTYEECRLQTSVSPVGSRQSDDKTKEPKSSNQK